MRRIYTILMYLLIPYLLLRLWWKSRKLPAYRKRILERFGLGKRKSSPVDVWVHAVSLGEVIAATPLIDALLHNGCSVCLTTMTPTGSERVQARFGDKVSHRYLPYDLPVVLKRFFKQIQPRVGVIIETELWPNLINEACKAKIPLLLANARLSERSLKGYMRFKFLFKPVLNQFSAVLAQSKDDAKRFISLGEASHLLHILGNMKFDVQTSAVETEQFQVLKQAWGQDRVVFIAASTHHDEEALILEELLRLQMAIPGIVLLIAPRHPERFQAVHQLCIQAGFNTALRSNPEKISPENEIIVLDSLGELLSFYQLSDYAFVGGSFVPVGGHNVLEPIAMKVPVLSGDQVHNFKSICQELSEAQAIKIVHSSDELIDEIIRLYCDKKSKEQMIFKASAVLEKNKGSMEKHLQFIESYL